MASRFSSIIANVQLPKIFFENPIVAICFPVICGGLIGYQSGTKAKTIYGTFYPSFGKPLFLQEELKFGLADLRQPPGKPPAKLFGPVWTTIYAATGFASFLTRSNPVCRSLYTISLLFNFAWTPLFFGNAMPGYALFDIAALWSTVALLLPEWYKADRRAGAIGAGYLAWVSFATYLNAGIWQLNYSDAARRAKAE